MAHNHRVIRKAHRCQTPIEALQLAEDINSLEIASKILSRVKVDSISENRDETLKEIWSVNQMLKKWKDRAQERLRNEFLKPD